MSRSKSERMQSFRRLVSHDAGNVAMLFGLLLLPMIGALGLAVDFGFILTSRTKAQVAADAAALHAAGVARDLIKNSDGSDAATSSALAEAKRRAELLFKAHADQSALTNYSATITVTRSAQMITSAASYSVNTTTHLAKLFGHESYQTTGSAVSSGSLPSYSDVYLALDVSASMGIAGSREDMITLFNASAKRTNGQFEKTGCVFACHVAEGHRAESNTTVAKRNNVTLRIDVMRKAVKAMIAEAEKDAESQPIYRLALYTFGGSLDASTWVLTKAAALSDNFAALTTAASAIDIQTSSSKPNDQRSYINEQLASMAGELTNSGDGSSQAAAKKYVFLITDGARDVPPAFGKCAKPSGSGRCTNAIDPSVCKTIKDKGIIMGVLYTTYIPVTENPADPNSKVEYWYNLEMVANKYNGASVAAQLPVKLEECASPGWYFQASDNAAIEVAMKKMFKQTTNTPRLTN